MFNRAVQFCRVLTMPQVFLGGMLLAIVLEAITLWLRFGLKMESTRDTTAIGALTFGIRIHHGYIGLVAIVLAQLVWKYPASRNLLMIVGIGLLVSDMVHHFLVLWPITGSPQFDLTYPRRM